MCVSEVCVVRFIQSTFTHHSQPTIKRTDQITEVTIGCAVVPAMTIGHAVVLGVNHRYAVNDHWACCGAEDDNHWLICTWGLIV